MKKKVKKFAMGGMGSNTSPIMGGMGSNTSPIQTGVRLAPPPNRVDGAPVRTLGMQNQQGGMPRGMGGTMGMGKLSNMSPQKIADLRSAAQQAGMGRGGMNAQQAAAQQYAQQAAAHRAATQAGADQAGMSRGLGGMSGLGGGIGGMGGGSSLPNSSGMKNSGGPKVDPQFIGDVLRKAQQAGVYNPLLAQQKGFASQLSRLTNDGKLSSFKKGGAVKASKSVSSASKRADGIATKGKTRGKMI